MLLIQDCRRILKKNDYNKLDELTDEQIGELRDFLYHLAKLQLESEEALRNQGSKSG